MRISNQKRLGFETLERREVPAAVQFSAMQLQQPPGAPAMIGEHDQKIFEMEVVGVDKGLDELTFTANGDLATFATGFTLINNVDGSKVASVHGTLNSGRLTFDLDPKVMTHGHITVSPDLVIGLPGSSCQILYAGAVVRDITTGAEECTYPAVSIYYNTSYATIFSVVTPPSASTELNATVAASATTPSQVTLELTSIGGPSVVKDLAFTVSANVTQVQVDLGYATTYVFPFTAANGTQVIWLRNVDYVVPAGEEGRSLTFQISYGNNTTETSPLSLEYMKYWTASAGTRSFGILVA